MGNHYLANADMGTTGRYPFSLGLTKRSIRNQNLAWSMIFGAEHCSAREAVLGVLMLRREESPEFPPDPNLVSHLGANDH